MGVFAGHLKFLICVGVTQAISRTRPATIPMGAACLSVVSIVLAVLLLGSPGDALASGPAAPAGVPQFISATLNPPTSVEVGETFRMEFELIGGADSGDHGGVSVSFPGLTNRDTNSSRLRYSSSQGAVRTASYTSGTANVSQYRPGDQIWTSLDVQVAADYLLVESDDPSWPSRTRRKLVLEVTPYVSGPFVINYRYWMCENEYTDCGRLPNSQQSSAFDRQQGWRVGSFTVQVEASDPAPMINSMGCSPTSVNVGQTVSCRPSLGGGSATGYDWDAPGGSPSSGTTRNFSTRWNTSGTKRIDLEVCNDSGCDDDSQTIVVRSTQGTCYSDWGALRTGNTRVNGAWDGSCASTQRSDRFARLYGFTLNQRTRLEIDLTSGEDTYLYILDGSNTRGSVLYADDDSGSGDNSYLDVTLNAGAYIIEATTFSRNTTGSFSLSVNATPAPLNCLLSGALPTGNTSVSGSWDGSCASTHRSGRYARFYAFTLTERTRVQIGLASSVDTYLYLLDGANSRGSVIHYDDNSGSGNNAYLDMTLDAGAYTIEATTSGSGLTGRFTLNINATPAPINCVQDLGTLPQGRTNVSGSWTGDCNSNFATGYYARFYTFTLVDRSRVTIDLRSTERTYVYLLNGAGTTGTVVGGDGGDQTTPNSTMNLTLDPGSYTVEATTFGRGVTGNFSLTINLVEELIFTLTSDPQPDLNKLAELQTELERQEVELNHGNPSPPIEIPLLEMLRQVDHTAIFVVEPDAEDSDYDARYNLAVSGTQNDVTVYIAASARQDITIVDSLGLYAARHGGDFMVEGSLSIRATDRGSRAFGIEGQCLAEGGFAAIIIEDDGGQTVDQGAILCGATAAGAMPEPCTQPLPRFSDLPELDPIHGEWISGCFSQHRPGRFARHYTFTLAADSSGSPTNLTVRLRSSVDTYLYLLEGAGPAGRIIAENDNGPSHLGTDSQIETNLGAGTYTVEATTNARALIGTFTLTVSGTVVSQAAPDFDGLNCSPITVAVGETVTCNPRLTGGLPDSYNWTATGGNPASGAAETFSTRWVSPGTQLIALEACNPQGCYRADQAIFVRERETPPSPPMGALGNPTNLRVANGGFGEALLTWEPADNAEVHWIWSVKADGTGGKWTQAAGDADWATVSDLQNGETYRFIIIAGSTATGVQQWSQWSQWVSFRVSGSGPAATAPTSIASGAHFSCLLEAAGSPVCWGQNDHGQATPPPGETFTAISGGTRFACGLRTDGSAVCWGQNDFGQADAPAGETFSVISSGAQHTCGLRPDGTPVCWGKNIDRTGAFVGQSTPPTGESFVAIGAGAAHTCALRANGTVRCWGSNLFGESSPPSGIRLASLSENSYVHMCGLDGRGNAVCWGINFFGVANPPVGETFSAIGSGDRHTCGLRPDGSVHCWGSASDGNGRFQGKLTPPPGLSFSSISVGWNHTCGITTAGSVACWGDDSQGQSTPPQQVNVRTNTGASETSAGTGSVAQSQPPLRAGGAQYCGDTKDSDLISRWPCGSAGVQKRFGKPNWSMEQL